MRLEKGRDVGAGFSSILLATNTHFDFACADKHASANAMQMILFFGIVRGAHVGSIFHSPEFGLKNHNLKKKNLLFSANYYGSVGIVHL